MSLKRAYVISSQSFNRPAMFDLQLDLHSPNLTSVKHTKEYGHEKFIAFRASVILASECSSGETIYNVNSPVLKVQMAGAS